MAEWFLPLPWEFASMRKGRAGIDGFVVIPEGRICEASSALLG